MTKSGEAVDTVVEVPHPSGIPPAPPAELDPYLDAAADVFARYGITRSSVQDIAHRLGLNRATVYRQVGNVDSAVRLLLAREIHRALGLLPSTPPDGDGADYVIDLVATLVTFARGHPVMVKVLDDEPELIGPFLVTDMPELIVRVSDTLRPLLDGAMSAGILARRDPAALAEWVTRIGLSLIIAPPAADLREFLAAVLRPALTPAEGDAM
jgi:AcrR family transcriptional regulator